MNLEGKRVLVTGSTGFIGGRLVEKLFLEEHARVRVLIRDFSHASRIARFPVEMVAGNIADAATVRNAVDGCDVVFHCAHETKLNRETKELTVVQGTQNISEAVLQAGVRRLVHLSSVSVYGPTLDGDLTESSAWQPSSHPYVRAKRATESLVLELHQHKNLPVVVLQPTIVYGPFCRPWTFGPVNQLKTGLVPLVDGGQGYCNAVYVDDVVDAMILAAVQPNILGETFLISAKEPVSWKRFYNTFETTLGICATIDISKDSLESMYKKNEKSKKFTTKFLNQVRSPENVSQIIKLRPVQASLKLLKDYLSEKQRHSLKARILRKNVKSKSSKNVEKQVHVPDPTLLALYLAQTQVCIDKAQQMLDYSPKFDFDHGMMLIAQFIHWSNLV